MKYLTALVALLLLLGISGCSGNINQTQLAKAEKVCAENEGIFSIDMKYMIGGADAIYAVCKNSKRLKL